MEKKFLLDASIIASCLEDFKRRFISSEHTLVLSDLTFRELEARKKDRNCEFESVGFARFLIDLFVRDTMSTEICIIESEEACKHVDEDLVLYAKDNQMTVLTCDKGMALWCRFYNVAYVLLETRSIVDFPFIKKTSSAVYLNLYDGSIPRGHSIYVYSTLTNRIISPFDKEVGTIYLNPGYLLLVAHSENKACCIDSYYINKDKALNLIEKNFYTSEEDIDDDKPLHKSMFKKWSIYMSKQQ